LETESDDSDSEGEISSSDKDMAGSLEDMEEALQRGRDKLELQGFYQGGRAWSKTSVSSCGPDLLEEASSVKDRCIPRTSSSDMHAVIAPVLPTGDRDSYLTRNRKLKGASAVWEEDRLNGPCRIEEYEVKHPIEAADGSKYVDSLSNEGPRSPDQILPKDLKKLSLPHIGGNWRTSLPESLDPAVEGFLEKFPAFVPAQI